jgi:glycerol transport system ATP-binding protein
MPCALDSGAALVEEERIPLSVPAFERAAARDGKLELGIRPEYLELARAGDSGAVPVTVNRVEDLGNFKIVTCRLGSRTLKAKLHEDNEVPGERAFLSFPPERIRLYADGELIGDGGPNG